MPVIEKGAVRINYEEAGSGFPMLIIPGAMLAPKSEVSLHPWKGPKERIPLAVRHIRSFPRAHQQWPRC